MATVGELAGPRTAAWLYTPGTDVTLVTERGDLAPGTTGVFLSNVIAVPEPSAGVLLLVALAMLSYPISAASSRGSPLRRVISRKFPHVAHLGTVENSVVDDRFP